MHVEHHALIHDFPGMQETLHRLRLEDRHFANLAEQYESLDKRICRAEDGVEPMGDVELERLKRSRVILKDEVASYLRQAAGQKTQNSGGCCGGGHCS